MIGEYENHESVRFNKQMKESSDKSRLARKRRMIFLIRKRFFIEI